MKSPKRSILNWALAIVFLRVALLAILIGLLLMFHGKEGFEGFKKDVKSKIFRGKRYIPPRRQEN